MIRVAVPANDADLATDRLWQWGVRAVSESAGTDGHVQLVTSVGNDDDAIQRAVATLDPTWSWTVDEVDTATTDDWKRFARPTWYRSGMVSVPAWLASDLRASGDLPAGTVMTVIEPGSAFGLGDHPTTRLSMAMLADAIIGGLPENPVRRGVDRVLDVGCGTGALAVLAAQLGVATVRAIDISDAAVAATRHNAALNDVAEMVDADTTSVARLTGPYDLIVANILAPALIAMASDLRRLLAPDGMLVISGILADDNGRGHEHVVAALEPLAVTATTVLDGWAAVGFGWTTGSAVT